MTGVVALEDPFGVPPLPWGFGRLRHGIAPGFWIQSIPAFLVFGSGLGILNLAPAPSGL